MTREKSRDDVPGRLSRLRIETGRDRYQAVTRLMIDGVDLLELQQPAVFRDGRPRLGGLKRFNPVDPVKLLPPDSPDLLPTTAGRSAMAGVCSCWEPGCGSLWLRVFRDDDTVVWVEDPDTPHDTVDRSWRFALLPYLDAVDAAAAGLAGEDRARCLARELRRRRDTLHGFGFSHHGFHLLDARAWPGIGEVRLTLSTPTGLQWPAVAVIDGESTDDFCLRVAHVDPDDPPSAGPGAT